MITYLLDINLLLALSDPMHIHHEVAHQWFASQGAQAWATCPLTENGFVRIASHPRYPNRPGDVGAVLAILRQFCAIPGHEFWTEDVSIRDLIEPNRIITHAQITDVFLLGLAVHKAGDARPAPPGHDYPPWLRSAGDPHAVRESPASTPACQFTSK